MSMLPMAGKQDKKVESKLSCSLFILKNELKERGEYRTFLCRYVNFCGKSFAASKNNLNNFSERV